MFQKLFGGDKKGKDKPKESGGKIEETLQMLDKKIGDMELLLKNLDVRQKNLQEEAKQKLKDGDKAGAKRLLTKKKKLLEQLKQTEGAMAMMEEQRLTLESTGQTKQIIDTLKETNQIVKDAMKELNVESLEQLKEEMEEIKEAQNEIHEFFTNYAEEGMDEVEDELKMLEQEEAAQAKNAIPSVNKEKLEYKEDKVKKEELDLDNFINS
jgi:chromosome segregation ATPase